MSWDITRQGTYINILHNLGVHLTHAIINNTSGQALVYMNIQKSIYPWTKTKGVFFINHAKTNELRLSNNVQMQKAQKTYILPSMPRLKCNFI